MLIRSRHDNVASSDDSTDDYDDDDSHAGYARRPYGPSPSAASHCLSYRLILMIQEIEPRSQ